MNFNNISSSTMDIMEENGTHFDENKKNLLSDVLDIGEIFTSMLLI